MTEIVASVNRITIRLTDERWAHITEEHSEFAEMRFEVLETVAQLSKFTRAVTEKIWLSGKLKRVNF